MPRRFVRNGDKSPKESKKNKGFRPFSEKKAFALKKTKKETPSFLNLAKKSRTTSKVFRAKRRAAPQSLSEAFLQKAESIQTVLHTLCARRPDRPSKGSLS